MCKISKPMRVFFKKTGRAKYISHLDLQRTMQRALKRAKLPVWETEGFNPHVYITFALPLSLGIESVCESFDVKIINEISTDEIHEKLNAVLTDDLLIIKVTEPVYKHTEIKEAMYEIVLEEAEKFRGFLNQNEIIITKKTKKGETEIDIKPLIELKEIKDNKITLILPTGNEFNLNPLQVIKAFNAFVGAELQADIMRTAIFCADGNKFI
ncbi:MAG: TIGR03936 family radical SAM-associated protein [Oscillospiraceae bacterium]|nr:TIGR03936 family radical SAM-associated protein [Oscillospiraceae bacterium]